MTSLQGRWVASGKLTMIAVMLLATVTALGACYLLYWREAEQVVTRQGEREALRVSMLAQLMQSELRPVVNNLRYLADGDGLRSYLKTGEADALEAAVRRARFFSEENPSYDQVRFLDQQGQEVFRVNRGGTLVAPEKLQNRADRRYFQQTSKLAAGELFISAFDLNVENGQIEQPLKPILRFAMPVFDAAGQRRGVYAINYLGADLIARLQQAAPTFEHRLRLLNSQGYWLKAADPGQEWGFLLPERSAHTVARSDPTLWSQMLGRTEGQLREANRLVTWQRIAPTEYADASERALRSDDEFLIMASEIEGDEWGTLFIGLQRIIGTASIGLVLLALISAWLFRGRWLAMRELRAANEELEQRVSERTTELARSLEQLQYREELLEETGQLAKVGGWDFDPVTGEGRWTPEVARIHDIDPALEPNKQLGLHFYPGESRVRLEAALQEAVGKGTPYDLELEFVSDRGVRKWVRTISRPVMGGGKVVHMRGALQDITAHKLSELQLRAQLQRLHLLEQITRATSERQDLASILQVMTRTLEEELPLDFCCVSLYDVTERSLTVAAVGIGSAPLAEELCLTERVRIPIDENGLSRCVRGQLVHEPDLVAHPFPFPQRLLAGGLNAMVAAPLRIESQVFGVLIAARRQAHSFSSGECEFLRQVSEHVALAANQAQMHGALQAAYEDLRDTQQAVMQQDRLRVLGQMASGIAHDINNSISPIMLYTESLLENESALSERARENLRTIRQAASDVADTVARMREFYRQRDKQVDLNAVPLNDLVHQTIELSRARWQAMPQQRGIVIEMNIELAAQLPAVMGIESEIREALTNLIFNAVDAMPQGGTLTVRSRMSDAQQVLLEIADTGDGMDEDTRRRCLEPFFTTKGERGTGLGLAMVYGVMRRHGGTIEIDSAPRAGTTFRLSFTVATPEAKIVTRAPLEVPANLTILLIDDDPIVLKSLRDTLELDGHTILVANGGQLGIDMFRDSQKPGAARISIVVTDLGMPHVDGRTVAAAIKNLSATTPIVLLTGWGERLLAEGPAPEHVDRVLSKPPRMQELRTAFAELLHRQANAGKALA